MPAAGTIDSRALVCGCDLPSCDLSLTVDHWFAGSLTISGLLRPVQKPARFFFGSLRCRLHSDLVLGHEKAGDGLEHFVTFESRRRRFGDMA